jgi:hypothetical protein
MTRTIVAIAIAALLGGTYFIVANGASTGSQQAPAVGFLH